MFAIVTADDFLQKLTEDHRSFQEDIANSGKAMNCILAAYHIHEWVWSRWLKPLPTRVVLNGTAMKDINSFRTWLDGHCPHFRLIQELANGAKHLKQTAPTRRIGGWGSGPYGVGPYGAAYLLIDMGEARNGDDCWLVASNMLKEVVDFWTKFFADATIPRLHASEIAH